MKLSSKALAILLIAISLLSTVSTFVWLNAIPQNQDYHGFADNHTHLGIPNFWNVISNLGFVIVGVWGIQGSGRTESLKTIKWVLFAGILLTGFGSAYYHLNPNNQTLVPDRLPMTIVFASFFCLILANYFGEKIAMQVWLLFLPVALGSVAYWHFTENLGQGDLRPYLLVQFLPILLLLVLVFFGSTQTPLSIKPLVLILIFYLFAKIAERYDHQIMEQLWVLGGHPIKHILASVSSFFMLRLAFDESKKNPS